MRSIGSISVSVVLACLLGACAAVSPPPAHDDPARYRGVYDVVWAAPDGIELEMDIFTPTSGKTSYPVVVMFHGGGWLIHDRSIMDRAARYLATNGEYVVCNVDYRLLSDSSNTVTLDEVVADAFGAVLWIKEHVADFGGDPDRIAVTGDSAGAHLAAMVVNLGNRLGSAGFRQTRKFQPTFLPRGLSAEQVADGDGLDVQAAVLNYGVYDFLGITRAGFESVLNPFWWMSGSFPRGVFGKGIRSKDRTDLYVAVSPVYHIPQASERMLPPQLLTVGSDDWIVRPESVVAYHARLEKAGHDVRFWEHGGRSHAYLNGMANIWLGHRFRSDAPPALDAMLDFLDSVFHP